MGFWLEIHEVSVKRMVMAFVVLIFFIIVTPLLLRVTVTAGDVTRARMSAIEARVVSYIVENHAVPRGYREIGMEQDYDGTLDGWGSEIAFDVSLEDHHGTLELTSLGKDGTMGGDGLNADIVQIYDLSRYIGRYVSANDVTE